MPYVVRIKQGGPNGKKRGEFGPFPTQATAKRQAQVIADDMLPKGHTCTVEYVGTRKKATKKRKNPPKKRVTKRKTSTKAKKGTGCRDSKGAYIPIPACGAGKKSPSPTKTIKVKGKKDGKPAELTYTLDSVSRSDSAAKKKVVALRKQGYKARTKKFPKGIGVYRRGRKKATTKSTAKKTRKTARKTKTKSTRASTKKTPARRRNSSAATHAKLARTHASSAKRTSDPVKAAFHAGAAAAHQESLRRNPRYKRPTMSMEQATETDEVRRSASRRSLRGRRLKVNPLVATETPTGKTTTGWITREGKLGGPGYTSKPAATRHQLLNRAAEFYGYRSTMGSLTALLRGRMSTAKKAKIKADINWLKKQKDWMESVYG